MKGISTSKTLTCKYEIENVGDSILMIFIKNLAYRKQRIKCFIYTNPFFPHSLKN